jgi:diguanylate cyclase (GGDEF)-like protein/PAS domain S-box-containing protein
LESCPVSQAEREEARLAALARYNIMDTPPEVGFDDLTRLAAQICGTPVALVGLIESDRQWYKSCYGYNIHEMPREIALCRFALQSDDLLMIPDLRLDPRFASHPLVTGSPFARFYAGAPLVTPEGQILGTLCVLDSAPKILSPEQEEALRSLSRQVVAQMELRRRLAALERSEALSRETEHALQDSIRQMRVVTDNVPALIARIDTQYRYLFSNRAYQQVSGIQPTDMLGRTVAQIFGVATFEMLRPTYERVLAGEELTCEIDIPFPTGPRFMQVSYVPERDSSGAVSGLTLSAIDITARQRAEEDVRRAEAKYRSIFENAVEGIFQSIPGGGFLSVNPALARILGYDSPDDLLASISDVGTQVYTRPQEREKLQQQFETQGVVYGYELEVRQKDGTTLWASLTARAVRDPETGGLLYIEGSAIDVTARRVAEDRMRQLADVVNSSNEAIISKTIDDVILSWNPGAERLYGYHADEAIGKRFNDLVPPALPAPSVPLTERLLSGQHVSHVERARYDRHGRRVEVSVSLSPIRDAQGHIKAISSIASDITSRKRAEHALLATQGHLQAVIDSTPLVLFALDEHGVFTLSEGKGLEKLGLRPGQAVGHSVWDLYRDEPAFLECIRQAYTGDLAASIQEVSGLVFDSHYTPMHDDSGRVIGILGVAMDVTKTKRAETAQRESEQRLQAIFNATSVGLATLSPDGRFLDTNPAYCQMLGYTPDEMRGMTMMQITHRSDLGANMAVHQETLFGERPGYQIQKRYARKDRTTLWASLTVTPLRDDEGRITCTLGVIEDITEHRRSEQQRRKNEAGLRRAHDKLADANATFQRSNSILKAQQEAALDGILVVDENQEIVSFNQRFCDLWHIPTELTGSRDDDPLLAYVMTQMQDPDEFLRQVGYLYEHPHERSRDELLLRDGRVFDRYSSPVYSPSGQNYGRIWYFRDITERKVLEIDRERMLHEAIERADRDPLTGLWNHRAFHKRLDEECSRAEQAGSTVAVVMMDLDNFKFFNDAYGHLAGDDVLRRVAVELTECARPGDTVARFGGDEFALLLPGLDATAARLLFEEACDILAEAGFQPEGCNTTIPLGLSAGIAVWPQDHVSRQEVVERADERLRLCKSGAEDLRADDLRIRMGHSLEGFSMLDALVTAVDNKDRYTRRHSEDVLMYSLQIAEELGMDEKARQTLAVAALLHDVGKIGVPDKVLRKPGKLTDEEFAAIKHHPMMGAIIVGAVPGLEDTLDAVRHHHERWDGGGYPFGMSGEETPLMARLMAVADAFSAMTTDRPYRKGMEHEKALAILHKGAGSQWDPVCVQAFLNAQRPALALAA